MLASQAPCSEGMALRTCLADLRTRAHIHPFPHLHDMSIHSHAIARTPLPDKLWVITDGALAGTFWEAAYYFITPSRECCSRIASVYK